MTESELNDLLPPLLHKAKQQGSEAVVDALRLVAPILTSLAPTVNGHSNGNGHAKRFSDRHETPAEFTAADVPDLKKYFAAGEDGTYPGHLHRLFGCSTKQFAQGSGLLQQLVTQTYPDGKQRRVWRWVSPDTVAQGKQKFAEPDEQPDTFPDPESWHEPRQSRALPSREIAPFLQSMHDAHHNLAAKLGWTSLDPQRVGFRDYQNATAHTAEAMHDRMEDAGDPRAELLAAAYDPKNVGNHVRFQFHAPLSGARDSEGHNYEVGYGSLDGMPRAFLGWHPGNAVGTDHKGNPYGFTAILDHPTARRIVQSLPEEVSRPLMAHLNKAPLRPPVTDPNERVRQPASVGNPGAAKFADPGMRDDISDSATHDGLPHILRAIHPAAWRSNPANVDVTPRLVASDYMRALGREQEADLLADTGKHLFAHRNIEDGQYSVHDAGEVAADYARRHGDRVPIENYRDVAHDWLLGDSLHHGHMMGNLRISNDVNARMSPGTIAAMLTDAETFRALHLNPEEENSRRSPGTNFAESRNDYGHGFQHEYPNRPELIDSARQFGPYRTVSDPETHIAHGPYEVPIPADGASPQVAPDEIDHNEPHRRHFADPPMVPKGEGGASHELLQHMLTTFQSPQHAINRGGGEHANHVARGQLADALQDHGREDEAALLRQPDQHVMVHQGQVVPARYTDRHYRAALRRLDQTTTQIAPDFLPSIIDWREDQTPESNGYVGVTHYVHGPNNEGNFDELHHSDMPDHLADTFHGEFAREVTESALPRADRLAFRKRLGALRTAPYEEPVPQPQQHSDTQTFAEYFAEPGETSASVQVAPGVPSKHIGGDTMYTHAYHDASGTKLGEARVIPRNDGDLLHIEWLGPTTSKPGENPGSLGTGHARAVLQQLIAHYPQATLLSGLHVGGIKTGQPKSAQRVVKEIPGRQAAREFAARFSSDADTEEAFQTHLDAYPDDHQHRMVFADWLQDRDDPRAEGYRALGANKFHATYWSGDERDRRYPATHYWGTDANLHVPYRGLPHMIPDDWMQAVVPTHTRYNPQNEPMWKHHNTRREADDQAALAFGQLPEERKAELLQPPEPPRPPGASQFAEPPRPQGTPRVPEAAPDTHPAAAHLQAIDAAIDSGRYGMLPGLAAGLVASKPEPHHVAQFKQKHLARLLRAWSGIDGGSDEQLRSLGIKDREGAKNGIDDALNTLRAPMKLPDELFPPSTESKPPLKWKEGVARPKPHLFTDAGLFADGALARVASWVGNRFKRTPSETETPPSAPATPKPPPLRASVVRHPDDGIVHDTVDPRTGKLANSAPAAMVEHAAVDRVMQNSGMYPKSAQPTERLGRRRQYMNVIRALTDHPALRSSPEVIAYRDAARLINPPTELDPDDPAAIHNTPSIGNLANKVLPLVKMAHDFIEQEHDPHDREPGRRPSPAIDLASPGHEIGDPSSEPEPIWESIEEPSAAAPSSTPSGYGFEPLQVPAVAPLKPAAQRHYNMMLAIRKMKDDPEALLQHMQEVYGASSRKSAQAMVRRAHAREVAKWGGTGQTFSDAATFAATPAGKPVLPEHTLEGVHPVLQGTTLAYHLNQLASKYPQMRDDITRALKWKGNPSAAGYDPFRAIGNQLRRFKNEPHPLAKLYDWNGIEQNMLNEIKLKQFIQKHVLRPAAVEGENPHEAELQYWDKIRRGLKANGEWSRQLWSRFQREHGGTISQEDAHAAIDRLGDNALDRAYLHATQDERQESPKPALQEWRDTTGATRPRHPAKVVPPAAPPPSDSGLGMGMDEMAPPGTATPGTRSREPVDSAKRRADAFLPVKPPKEPSPKPKGFAEPPVQQIPASTLDSLDAVPTPLLNAVAEAMAANLANPAAVDELLRMVRNSQSPMGNMTPENNVYG